MLVRPANSIVSLGPVVVLLRVKILSKMLLVKVLLTIKVLSRVTVIGRQIHRCIEWLDFEFEAERIEAV